jgi:hypothetical protein
MRGLLSRYDRPLLDAPTPCVLLYACMADGAVVLWLLLAGCADPLRTASGMCGCCLLSRCAPPPDVLTPCVLPLACVVAVCCCARPLPDVPTPCILPLACVVAVCCRTMAPAGCADPLRIASGMCGCCLLSCYGQLVVGRADPLCLPLACVVAVCCRAMAPAGCADPLRFASGMRGCCLLSRYGQLVAGRADPLRTAPGMRGCCLLSRYGRPPPDALTPCVPLYACVVAV